MCLYNWSASPTGVELKEDPVKPNRRSIPTMANSILVAALLVAILYDHASEAVPTAKHAFKVPLRLL